MASTTFSFRLSDEIKTRLETEAALEERSAAYVVQKAVEEYLDTKEYKRECLREAIAEADKGVFISEEAMDAWVESWGTDGELPMPEPDIVPMKA